MDLNAFRAETREWIEANCPEGDEGPTGQYQSGHGPRRSALARSHGRKRVDCTDGRSTAAELDGEELDRSLRAGLYQKSAA